MPSVDEKRQCKREKSFVITYINNKKGYITDISEKGCQIFLEGVDPKISSGNLVDIKIEMSEYNEIGQILYSFFKGQVMWAQVLDEFTIMGISFALMDSKQEQSLKKIIHYWNFLNSTFG